jgi:hypothetical protein
MGVGVGVGAARRYNSVLLYSAPHHSRTGQSQRPSRTTPPIFDQGQSTQRNGVASISYHATSANGTPTYTALMTAFGAMFTLI